MFYIFFLVFNATFHNISVISWQSVLLVEETGDPWKTTDLSEVTDKLYHIMLPQNFLQIIIKLPDVFIHFGMYSHWFHGWHVSFLADSWFFTTPYWLMFSIIMSFVQISLV